MIADQNAKTGLCKMIPSRRLLTLGAAPPLARRLSAAVPGREPYRFPVVLVHGFRVISQDGDESSLNTMEAALWRRGFDTHRFTYKPKEDTVQGHALALAAFLLEQMHAGATPHREGQRQGPALGLVSHSFGGPLIRAAMNTSLWRTASSGHVGPLHPGRELRCAMLAPPSQGSALARALRPQSVSDDAIDMWSSAVSLFSERVLGTKAGLELASLDNGSSNRLFGPLPDFCKALVIAGDCGTVHPILQGPNDGVVTVAETLLDSRHSHLTLFCPHNLISDHPAAVRAVLAFMASQVVPGSHIRNNLPIRSDRSPI